MAIAWIVPLALSAFGLFFFSVFIVTADGSNLQCAAAFMITAVPFSIAAAEAPDRLLHPLSVFGFTLVLGLAGQTVYLTVGESGGLPDLLSGLRTDVLTPGILVMSVAIGALALGYWAGTSDRTPTPSRLMRRAVARGLGRPSADRTFWAVMALCGLAVVAFVLYAPKVGIQTPADLFTSRKRFAEVEGGDTVFGYHRFGISLAGVAFILGAFTMVRRGVPWNSRLGGAVILSLALTAAYATITSSRTELFATLAAATFMAVAIRGREPRPWKIVAVVVVAMLGVTLLGGLRAVNQGEATSLSSTFNADALVEEAVGARAWSDIGPISVVVERVPEAYDYQYGETMASILWAPIPKAVWPGKPAVRLGPKISPAVFGFDLDRRTGDPPGLVGELWLNGGLLAVVIGMIAFGLLLKRVERWNRLASATGGLSAIPYGVLVVALCLKLPVSDVTGVLSSILQDLPLLAVLVWIVRDVGRGAAEVRESTPPPPSTEKPQNK